MGLSLSHKQPPLEQPHPCDAATTAQLAASQLLNGNGRVYPWLSGDRGHNWVSQLVDAILEVSDIIVSSGSRFRKIPRPQPTSTTERLEDIIYSLQKSGQVRLDGVQLCWNQRAEHQELGGEALYGKTKDQDAGLSGAMVSLMSHCH
ncbi:hypothetical protein CB1_000490006 [Camelus ferus]|nr:hypothetical protein CB1_000490006 [Camelus ferus]